MDEEQVRTVAGPVVLDACARDVDERHQFSRFLEGGKSREYTGFARNAFGS